MKYKKFDYYIFIDFSENLIGYNIISHKKMLELLPKISKFRHYLKAKKRKLYLKNVNKTIKREKIKSYFIKFKIRSLCNNALIYADILEFINNHENCIIFISVDNRQFKAFEKLVGIIDGERIEIKKESELKRGTLEYQTSLVLDNLLNIERKKQK
jgi:hypothetical protein